MRSIYLGISQVTTVMPVGCSSPGHVIWKTIRAAVGTLADFTQADIELATVNDHRPETVIMLDTARYLALCQTMMHDGQLSMLTDSKIQ